MAEENEQGQAQPQQQDAGTTGEGQQQQAAEASQQAENTGSQQTGVDDQNQSAESGQVDYKGEYEKLNNQVKELQSQFTTTSQELSRQQELMRTLEPYIDYNRYQQGQPGQQQGQGQQFETEEGEEVYLTDKQVKDMLNKQASTFRQELVARDIRAKYPDVCDNGPKEVIVRWHLQNKTSPHEDPQKRIERAVQMTREILESERKAGQDQAEKQRKAAEEEAKKKAAAAAQMSGTASTGKTSPSQPEPPQQMSGQSYIEQRRAKRDKTKNVSPV